MPAKHLIVHGKVQGVWYRGWTVDTARALGLHGWVRNRRDGTVEATISGSEAAMNRFIAMAREGPKAAKVSRIDLSDAAEAEPRGFTQRPTV